MKINDHTLGSYYTPANASMMRTEELTRLYSKFLNPTSTMLIRFVGANIRFVKANGGFLTDYNGEKYSDFICGFGSLNLGHEPKEVISALRMAENNPNFFPMGLNPFAARLAEFLQAVTPGKLSRTFFCNSGTESVEAAIKLARAATGKKKLITTIGAFHGKTLGSLSLSGKKKYQTPFEPLIPDIKIIPYNDLDALKEELSAGDVAGFIVEPIQGEAGVIIPEKGYLKKAQQLCNQKDALFIADEVQTGMGRTGKLFCCEYEEVEPDIMCISKSLSGGVVPIGATITTDRIWKKAYGSLSSFYLQSSTFGGNSRACACGIAALNTLLSKDLIGNALVQGEYFLSCLNSLKNEFPVIKEVRGKGLMIAINFFRLKGKSSVTAGGLILWITRQLFRKHHIITGGTPNNYDVLRILPPLSIQRAEIDRFVESLKDVLRISHYFEKFKIMKSD